MLKQLLMSAALATVAISASAESKVLWQADSPEGEPISGWHTFYEMTAEEAAVFNDYDVIYMTITAKGTEGWPQVALFEGGVGWPPFINAGAGDSFPKKATMALTPEALEAVHANGLSFRGESVYVSEIGYETSTFEVDPNAVWIGPKECGWGDPASVPAEVFADVKVGDKIVVEYDPNFEGMNVNLKFNGWGACSVNYWSFDKVDFITLDSEKGSITVNLTAATEKFNWADGDNPAQDWNLIELLKENGFMVQGPSIINQIIYIPGEGEVAEDPVFPKTIEYTINGEKELAGVDVVIKEGDYGPSMSITGESDAESIALTFAVPEGWDGWIISADWAEVSEQPMAKTRSEEDWYPLDFYLNMGFKKGNTVTFAVEEDDNYATLALYKGDKVYNVTIDIEYNVVPAGGVVVTDPVFPESLGVTTYAEGLEVEQNNEDGEIFIAVTGEIEETTFDVVLDVPEGWTGFISMPVETDDVTISEGNEGPSDPRMSKVQEADWVPVEDVMDEGVFKGNKFTFKANGTRLQVEVHLYKDDMVDVANFITLTANVKSKLVEANQAAYEEVISKIEAVEKEYAESLDALKKEYPDYDFSEWETIIGGQLTQAKEGAAQALAAANEDGADFNFAFDEDEYMNMISEMNARVPLLASNQAAYEAVIAQLDELQKKSDEAAAKIKEMNPDYDLSALDELNAMIEEYRQYALIALNNANEEGEEFFFPFDAEEYEAYIAMEVMTATPAPEYPESFEITSSCESLDIEQEDFDGATIVTVTGACPEKEYTITVKVPEGWDGFIGASDADGGNEPMPLMDKVVKETEWWFVSDMLAQGLRMTNSFTFPADGEEHYAQLMLVKGEYADVVNHINIDVKVSYDATVGVSGVNAEENAIYFDLQGNRIANPAKGIYVKVVDGKATKINVR